MNLLSTARNFGKPSGPFNSVHKTHNMEIPAGEIEFQSNYRLLELGKQTLASPMAALGFPGFTAAQEARNNMEVHLKKLDIHNAKMKVLVAQECTNGESFTHLLESCRTVLERIVAINQSKMGNSSSCAFVQIHLSTTGLSCLHNTYHYIVEKLLFYFQNIKQGRREMGITLLDVLCLIVTLDTESHAIYPQVFSSCLLFFQPTPAWKDSTAEVMNRLCYYILPKCLVCELQECPWMNLSASIMMVLEGCSTPKDHLFLINTLMQLKKDVCLDILSTMAYGTPAIRQKALDLLLYYWPSPIPEFSQRSNSIYREWSTPVCENSGCPHKTGVGSMLCVDPLCVTRYKAGDHTKLYMLLCSDCDSVIHGSPPGHPRLRIPRHLHDVKPNCEFQKICSGKERQVNRAEVTCYDPHCTKIQNGQPIRMCRDCHNKQHRDITDPGHIYQVCPPDPWAQENPALCAVMLEAVSKLLDTTPTRKDMPPQGHRGVGTIPRSANPHHVYPPSSQIEVGLSKEGVWLLYHYCTPTTAVQMNQQDWLVRLVALTLHWLQSYFDLLHSAFMAEEGLVSTDGVGDYVETRILVQDYSHIFANYADISNLVNSYALPWFRSVCESNLDCVSEVLKPDIPGSAQVGAFWNESRDPIERSKRTLSMVHTIYLLFQDGKLPERTFMTIFKTVMPLWLDYVNGLRSEPGKMQLLQDQIRMIFSHEKHEEGLKTFGFIWDLFRTGDTEGMHKALLWLQDLTRLKVPIAYLKHMFEDVFKERHRNKPTVHRFLNSLDSGSSFDQESEISKKKKRESTGSLSGYDSESALLSQSSLDTGAETTQVLITLNSSLTRFIIMLDIWLSQLLEHQVSILESSSLQAMLVKMLRHVWGSNHTFQDHREPVNICLLCRGTELWFSLASKLISEYARREREDSAVEPDGPDDLTSPVGSRPGGHRSIKIVDKIATPIQRGRRKFISASESPDIRNLQRPRKKVSAEDVDMIELPSLTPAAGEDDPPLRNVLDLQRSRLLPPHQAGGSPRQLKRKVGNILSHSELEIDSSFGGVSRDQQPPSRPDTEEEGVTSALYTIFQLTIGKLSYKLHPDAVLQIVECLVALIRNVRVLKKAGHNKQVTSDLTQLFEKLWRCLEVETSNVARSCVGLLLECANYLVTHHTPEGGVAKKGEREDEEVKSKLSGGKKEGDVEGRGVFWKSLRNGLTANSWTTRYKTIEKLTNIVQFMLDCEVVGIEHQSFHHTLKLSLAHGFCLLTQLLQDKNSSVCSRVRYCITSIKESSLEAIRQFLLFFFRECPPHQSLVVETLSLLDSALPEMHFVNLDLLNKLMGVALHGLNTPSVQEKDHVPLSRKKVSETSLLSSSPFAHGGTPKLSVASSVSVGFGGGVMRSSDPVTTGLVQQILSLLLRHIGNPRENVKASMRKAQQGSGSQQPKRGATIKKSITSGTSEEMFTLLLQRDFFDNLECFPEDLRKNPIFDVFLNHVSLVLDHNVSFGHTKEFLLFLLKLLGFSAAPDRDDYKAEQAEEKSGSGGQGPAYGLGALPSHLQAPWLRLFFVILYKYIHEYFEVGDTVSSNPVFTLARWCFKITLNTLEATPHNCPLLNAPPTRGKVQKPPLKRQLTVDSTNSSSSSVGGEESLDIKGGVAGREGVVLTPVPEDFEESKDSVNFSIEEEEERVGVSASPTRVTFTTNPPLPKGGRSTSLSRGPEATSTSTTSETTVEARSAFGRCVVCGGPTNEFSEDVIALSAVVVGTYASRLPHVVPRYLVSRIIPAFTRIITPGAFSWQKFSNSSNPLPGSATAVAQHLLASVLTQFAERRLFVYLFGYKYGDSRDTVFAGIANSLISDGEGEVPLDSSAGGSGGGGGGGGGMDKEGEVQLYSSSPIKYFLEDALSSSSFNQDISRYSFANLACYLRSLEEGGFQIPPILLTRDLLVWDAFLKKLKGHSEVLQHQESVRALLEVIVRLFQYSLDYQHPQWSLSNYRAHAVQSFIQSLLSIVETALHSVYCPLGGIVMLGGLWYKVFQQHSHRESEKFVKLVIAELRKALKMKVNLGDVVVHENFLGLIQVLLLEENGYLGYVDSVTPVKQFALELKQDYETHCLPVIESSQWDLVDALNFLSTPSINWPQETVPQLKLSLAQLISLRVQHSRSPAEKLRRMIAGDNKALISSGSKSAIAGLTLWHSSLNSLHMLSWLLLGAMSHNAIHSVATEMRSVSSSGGLCLLLQSLSPKIDDVLQKAISLTRNVLKKIYLDSDPEPKLDYIEMTFLFGTIFTVYLELYVEGSAPLILEYWEKVSGCLAHQVAEKVNTCQPQQLSSTIAYCTEVIHSLDEQVVARVRDIDLSCYTLILPVLQEVADKCIPGKQLEFVGLGTARQCTYSPVDVWFDEAVGELFRIEMESIPNNSFR